MERWTLQSRLRQPGASLRAPRPQLLPSPFPLPPRNLPGAARHPQSTASSRVPPSRLSARTPACPLPSSPWSAEEKSVTSGQAAWDPAGKYLHLHVWGYTRKIKVPPIPHPSLVLIKMRKSAFNTFEILLNSIEKGHFSGLTTRLGVTEKLLRTKSRAGGMITEQVSHQPCPKHLINSFIPSLLQPMLYLGSRPYFHTFSTSKAAMEANKGHGDLREFSKFSGCGMRPLSVHHRSGQRPC